MSGSFSRSRTEIGLALRRRRKRVRRVCFTIGPIASGTCRRPRVIIVTSETRRDSGSPSTVRDLMRPIPSARNLSNSIPSLARRMEYRRLFRPGTVKRFVHAVEKNPGFALVFFSDGVDVPARLSSSRRVGDSENVIPREQFFSSRVYAVHGRRFRPGGKSAHEGRTRAKRASRASDGGGAQLSPASAVHDGRPPCYYGALGEGTAGDGRPWGETLQEKTGVPVKSGGSRVRISISRTPFKLCTRKRARKPVRVWENLLRFSPVR